MRRIEALGSSVFVLVLTAGTGCTEETVFGTADCNDLYGNLTGYELCEQTDSSCIFYQSETPAISCAAICAFSGASCIKAYGHEGGACDPNDVNGCPPGNGFAQFCSLADGNTCVNVCQGAVVTGGCELDTDCTSPLTCDNDRVGASSCECVMGGTGGTGGERNVCDVGAEIPCDQPQSDAVCECGRPQDGGTGGSGGSNGTGDCANFSGTWVGTFQCIFRTTECGAPFGGDITIEVMQEGCSATYSDGTATFQGTVSGDVFEFHEMSDPPTETGTLTLLSPNTAHKESTFTLTDGCIGDCQDDLSR